MRGRTTNLRLRRKKIPVSSLHQNKEVDLFEAIDVQPEASKKKLLIPPRMVAESLFKAVDVKPEASEKLPVEAIKIEAKLNARKIDLKFGFLILV